MLHYFSGCWTFGTLKICTMTNSRVLFPVVMMVWPLNQFGSHLDNSRDGDIWYVYVPRTVKGYFQFDTFAFFGVGSAILIWGFMVNQCN